MISQRKLEKLSIPNMSDEPEPKLMECALIFIMKNESKCVTETLQNVLDLNKKTGRTIIDGYICSDTGSTDGSQDIVRNFMKEHGIPGQVFEDPWDREAWGPFDFAVARTRALKHCEGRAKYAFFMDCDDLIQGTPDWPLKLTQDSYLMVFGNNFTYTRRQIFKISAGWRYRLFLHEYPECSKKKATEALITGDYYIDSRRLGSRNQDPLKYYHDALRFENGLCNELTRKIPSVDRSRMFFYCGNSWFDDQHHPADAIRNYERRIKEGGWLQEVFISHYRIAESLEKLGKDKETVTMAYLRAHACCPLRNEAIYKVACYYGSIGEYDKAYKHAEMGIHNKYSIHFLFAVRDYYEYAIHWLMMQFAFQLCRFDDVVRVGKLLFAGKEHHELGSTLREKPEVIQQIKQLMKLSLTEISNKNKKRNPAATVVTGNFVQVSIQPGSEKVLVTPSSSVPSVSVHIPPEEVVEAIKKIPIPEKKQPQQPQQQVKKPTVSLSRQRFSSKTHRHHVRSNVDSLHK